MATLKKKFEEVATKADILRLEEIMKSIYENVGRILGLDLWRYVKDWMHNLQPTIPLTPKDKNNAND